MHCTSLREVLLPTTLHTIRVKAFMNCAALVELAIPPSLRYIGSRAFLDCTVFSRLAKMPGRHKWRGVYAEENAFAICPAPWASSIATLYHPPVRNEELRLSFLLAHSVANGEKRSVILLSACASYLRMKSAHSSLQSDGFGRRRTHLGISSGLQVSNCTLRTSLSTWSFLLLEKVCRAACSRQKHAWQYRPRQVEHVFHPMMHNLEKLLAQCAAPFQQVEVVAIVNSVQRCPLRSYCFLFARCLLIVVACRARMQLVPSS